MAHPFIQLIIQSMGTVDSLHDNVHQSIYLWLEIGAGGLIYHMIDGTVISSLRGDCSTALVEEQDLSSLSLDSLNTHVLLALPRGRIEGINMQYGPVHTKKERLSNQDRWPGRQLCCPHHSSLDITLQHPLKLDVSCTNSVIKLT